MTANTSRILIETTVRKTIKDIANDPERSIRRVVDMAVNFSNGRFQKHLFVSAQKMLSNDQSAYYSLVRDTVGNINTEKLVHFGMNLGYNSCTAGAKILREIEEKRKQENEALQYEIQQAKKETEKLRIEAEQLNKH